MSEKQKTVFNPVRGYEENILKKPYTEGNLYFAIDSRKIFLDANGHNKVPMGSSGVTLFYGLEEATLDPLIDGLYTISYNEDAIQDYQDCKIGDLILNNDGNFYKITDIDKNSGLVYCTVMAVSGSGGGGGGGEISKRGRVSVTNLGEPDILNGSTAKVSILVNSQTIDGDPVQGQIPVLIYFYALDPVSGIYKQYLKVPKTLDHGVPFEYDVTEILHQNVVNKIKCEAQPNENNVFSISSNEVNISSHSLSVEWDETGEFSANGYFENKIPVHCNITSSVARIFDLYVSDSYGTDYLVYTAKYDENSTFSTPSYTITPQSNVLNLDGSIRKQGIQDILTHGSHKIKAKLSLQKTDGTRGDGTDIIIKEVGYLVDKSMPLIWLGDYKDEYYEYDTIYLNFKVYDNQAGANGANVKLYKDTVLIEGGDRFIQDPDNNWGMWEITDLSAETVSTYRISIGQDDRFTFRDIVFNVVKDPRNMKYAGDPVIVFDSKGRSNTENKISRESLVINGNESTFKNFNWYNNGWVTGSHGATCLRVSNGAQFTFPLGKAMEFYGGGGSNSAHTVEIQYEIRNVADYSKIITNYTRYKGIKEFDDSWRDDAIFNLFKAQLSNDDSESNYDTFLANYLKEHAGEQGMPTYDDLEYNNLEKDMNFSNVVMTFGSSVANAPGIYIGTQDACFTNGTNTVSLDFIEGEIINLSFVYTPGTPSDGGGAGLLEIYLNGILTSVIRSSRTNSWSISNNSIIFDSKNCDIDIYKLRVYDSGLSAQDIIQNYAFDLKNVDFWDQKDLATLNKDLGEYEFSYDAMIDYNKAHPNNPLMPYIVLYTTNENSQNRLPYNKEANDVKGQMEFVNTVMDAAYANGSLAEVAEKAGYKTVEDYYNHHCPSWKSEEDAVSMSVQGTSSQFYPRRNVKAKTGGSMLKHKGPYEEMHKEYLEETDAEAKAKKKADVQQSTFFMDNDSVGTDKFTLKIDYMESSGNYNRGFANMVSSVYSKHPLDDYNNANAIQHETSTYDPATSYKEGTTYYYLNHKDEWKDVVATAEQFAAGPIAYVVAKNGDGLKILQDKTSPYYNKWCVSNKTFGSYKVPDTKDLRTSVQGFPVLAFHKPDNGKHLFIGKYNMLIDKGSDACYGFKTNEKDIANGFVLNDKDQPQKLSEVAECWEFENNSRGFCSFRDPWNRRTLSFEAPSGVDGAYTSAGAPIVADSFEYRYNVNKDIIDLLIAIDESGKDDGANQALLDSDFKNNLVKKGVKKVKVTTTDENGVSETVTKVQNSDGNVVSLNNVESSNRLLLDMYSNWEKAVAWVWSTATDCMIDTNGDGIGDVPVPSIGTYSEIALAEALYEPNKYYLLNDEGIFVKEDSSAVFDINKVYHKKTLDENNKEIYPTIILTTEDSGIPIYETKKYYIALNLKDNIFELSEEAFDGEQQYYTLEIDQDSIDAFWALERPVTYEGDSIIYTKDTKEYRQAKFKNELAKHFSIEYLSTYFLMTEIFECYDSRGKNCMMASWGPQKEGGDYIWYPIFYDIDTQLGINNTGIPSFEYYIDATLDGSFSTNDSVLWNNFYYYFKGNIVAKYKQLMNQKQTVYPAMDNPLFKRDVLGSKISRINKFYESDPEITNSYSMKGDRPLMAINCDEYFKYITPTNTKAKNKIQGRIDEDGVYQVEKDTYFYALQGDRKLYREQFLNNRIEYIDSWLTLDHYARGGTNRIRSRVSANNPTNTSDKWIQGVATNGMSELNTNVPYWKNGEEYGEKTHEFDGEYWITFTPIRKSYVTVGTDAANFPSLKYDKQPVKFTTTDLRNGVMNSGNYKEQLYYVYGLGQMKSLGDMSKLYLQEFELSGTADKMTDLLLGYDGLEIDGENVYTYKNENVNDWTIPAGTSTGGMPLLKEVNLSNIIFKNNTTEDFSSCEKLENYRNIGSNILSTQFADGVALNTLHLTAATTELKLTEARLLTNIIENYVPPVKNKLGKLEFPDDAGKGLYIEGLTDKQEADLRTNIITLQLDGGSLDYDSYKLLTKYYRACYNSDAAISSTTETPRAISLTKVQWAPLMLIEDDKLAYNSNSVYYKDNGHFGLEPYVYTTLNQWKIDIKNKVVYLFTDNVNGVQFDGDHKPENVTNIKDDILDILSDFSNRNSLRFQAVSGADKSVPTLTGIVYINNEEKLDESYIQRELKDNFPDMTFFFKNVNKGFSANFIIEENGIETLVNQQKISVDEYNQKPNTYFKSPIDNTSSATYLSPSKLIDLKGSKYVLKGWATDKEGQNMVIKYNDIPAFDIGASGSPTYTVEYSNWDELVLNADVNDYNFYAIFVNKKFIMRFYNGDMTKENAYVMEVNEGDIIKPPTAVQFIPTNESTTSSVDNIFAFDKWLNKSGENEYMGFGQAAAAYAIEFIPTFVEKSIYDESVIKAHSDYFTKADDTYTYGEWSYSFSDKVTQTGIQIIPKPGIKLPKKVIIPATLNGEKVVSIGKMKPNETGVTHLFIEPNNGILEIGDLAFAYLINSNKTSGFNQADFSKDNPITYIDWRNLTLLRTIGQWAFAGCQNIYNGLQDGILRLPESLVGIGAGAFNKSILQDLSREQLSIYIPSGIKEILNQSFYFTQMPSTTGDSGRENITIYLGDSENPIDLAKSPSNAAFYKCKVLIFVRMDGMSDENLSKLIAADSYNYTGFEITRV